MDEFTLFRLAGLTAWVPTLMLVLFRMAGLFLVAPMFSNRSIPTVVKAMIAIVVALAVTARMDAPAVLPSSWVPLIVAIGCEMLIGGVLGYAAQTLFLGVEAAGQHIGQQMGIALANVYDPQSQATTNIAASMLNLTALAAFLLMGGHRLMLAAMLQSFRSVPLMGFRADADLLGMIAHLLTAAFVLGVKMAAPVLIVLMLSSVAMGLIQRTMPQFNILSAGFQIRIMVALIVLTAALAALPPLLEQMWDIIDRALAGAWRLT